ncbi:MICOS complex subunit Mic10 [Acropora cervicornis]|uniref:MICOS complex subunit MIC10 n=1 Tax=Acropora cervicornis TaxID=6130 RepID=A0AAD9PYL7_ACRCE|nr:MICOS complex subunit Mic10 [Acropora cervicornis]
MAPVQPSEDEIGRKWDRCLVDTTFKIGSAWPVTLGIGIGVGAGYSNCRHQFFSHGSHRPPFGRPPWGGGRPWWPGYGKGGEFQQSPCHQETKVKKQYHYFICYYF